MQVPGGTVSLNLFKLYLGRMLGQCDQGSDNDSDALLFYNQSTRIEIGNVLSASPDLGKPGPYIPEFYRDCSAITVGCNSEVHVYKYMLYYTKVIPMHVLHGCVHCVYILILIFVGLY